VNFSNSRTVVGNYQNQIKFSELTLDMYRILQSLEREPTSQNNVAKEKTKAAAGDDEGKDPAVVESEIVVEEKEAVVEKEEKPGATTRRNNPHKYLLYKPTFAQLMLYIATAFKVFEMSYIRTLATTLHC
jgi:hypothetical protein